jgi:DNA-binding beta-propeller fold protein YncE
MRKCFYLNGVVPGVGEGEFNGPHGIAIDSLENVYVVDSFNNRVQKFTSDGTFIREWGSFGTGDGQFNNPIGIEVDSSGQDIDRRASVKFGIDLEHIITFL